MNPRHTSEFRVAGYAPVAEHDDRRGGDVESSLWLEQLAQRANPTPTSQAPLRNSLAFSLVEILTVVALLTFIILGLVAMFNQTRRAFMSSMTQVDVLGSGRMAADLIAREVEQVASTSPTGTNVEFNFWVQGMAGYTTPLVQPLDFPPSGTDNWTNNLHQLYFVTRNNQQWSAIGYRLATNECANGIGTLYRFGSTNIDYTNCNALATAANYFNTSDPTINNYWSRIIDGVVDFRVRTFDQNGNPIQATNVGLVVPVSVATNFSGEYAYEVFRGDALPAYAEIELGVLEDRTLAKYQALASAGTGPNTAAWGYLTNHAAQVHIFRQRIPIRNVNPLYP